AVCIFLNENEQTNFSHHLLSHKQVEVLQDIHQVLKIPHAAQELLSAEKTPTLSLSLPVYTMLINKWKDLKNTIPEIVPYIKIRISKLEEYIGESCKT
ncbi:hypothetical protein DXG03_005756, partial [Asterophora parasitica]